MAKRLSVPPELEYLIEKREAEQRQFQRRLGFDRRDSPADPTGETAGSEERLDQVEKERRSGDDSRTCDERRRVNRRSSGPVDSDDA